MGDVKEKEKKLVNHEPEGNDLQAFLAIKGASLLFHWSTEVKIYQVRIN